TRARLPDGRAELQCCAVVNGEGNRARQARGDAVAAEAQSLIGEKPSHSESVAHSIARGPVTAYATSSPTTCGCPILFEAQHLEDAAPPPSAALVARGLRGTDNGSLRRQHRGLLRAAAGGGAISRTYIPLRRRRFFRDSGRSLQWPGDMVGSGLCHLHAGAQ